MLKIETSKLDLRPNFKEDENSNLVACNLKLARLLNVNFKKPTANKANLKSFMLKNVKNFKQEVTAELKDKNISSKQLIIKKLNPIDLENPVDSLPINSKISNVETDCLDLSTRHPKLIVNLFKKLNQNSKQGQQNLSIKDFIVIKNNQFEEKDLSFCDFSEKTEVNLSQAGSQSNFDEVSENLNSQVSLEEDALAVSEQEKKIRRPSISAGDLKVAPSNSFHLENLENIYDLEVLKQLGIKLKSIKFLKDAKNFKIKQQAFNEIWNLFLKCLLNLTGDDLSDSNMIYIHDMLEDIDQMCLLLVQILSVQSIDAGDFDHNLYESRLGNFRNLSQNTRKKSRRLPAQKNKNVLTCLKILHANIENINKLIDSKKQQPFRIGQLSIQKEMWAKYGLTPTPQKSETLEKSVDDYKTGGVSNAKEACMQTLAEVFFNLNKQNNSNPTTEKDHPDQMFDGQPEEPNQEKINISKYEIYSTLLLLSDHFTDREMHEYILSICLIDFSEHQTTNLNNLNIFVNICKEVTILGLMNDKFELIKNFINLFLYNFTGKLHITNNSSTFIINEIQNHPELHERVLQKPNKLVRNSLLIQFYRGLIYLLESIYCEKVDDLINNMLIPYFINYVFQDKKLRGKISKE